MGLGVAWVAGLCGLGCFVLDRGRGGAVFSGGVWAWGCL